MRPARWAPVLAALLFPALPMSAPAQTTGPGPEQESSPASEATASVLERALESRTKGSADAEVVVFEIADFQCPYCARFSDSVAPTLDERYVAPGHLQWVFVNLPLHTHPLAWHAAEAALCAGAVGDRFWAMHDRLFAEQDEWGGAADPGSEFEAYAAALGVPAAAFERCTARDEVAGLILQDYASAVSAGITGTPTFIVMKDDQVIDRIVGLRPVEEWARILDEALRR